MSKQAILYARSATGEGEALARQLETCRRWAQANGYTVTGEYSEVASGTASVLPERGKAIAQAQSEGAALVCMDSATLSRNMKQYVRCATSCKRRCVPVFFVVERPDQKAN